MKASARIKAAIGLGSNLGDRLGNLRQALAFLSESGVSILERSHVYETPPYGKTDQPLFLNATVIVEHEGDALSLLALLKGIEKRIGRQDRGHWGPREIDLDLLMIPGFTYRDENLEVPHPGIADRAFVLVPLAEIAPHWVHPVIGLEVAELAGRFKAEALSFCRIALL
jgi:2-amino-4-hydroxy-6-hydroxymethyldihydropteridine diphosphokinase